MHLSDVMKNDDDDADTVCLLLVRALSAMSALGPAVVRALSGPFILASFIIISPVGPVPPLTGQ